MSHIWKVCVWGDCSAILPACIQIRGPGSVPMTWRAWDDSCQVFLTFYICWPSFQVLDMPLLPLWTCQQPLCPSQALWVFTLHSFGLQVHLVKLHICLWSWWPDNPCAIRIGQSKMPFPPVSFLLVPQHKNIPIHSSFTLSFAILYKEGNDSSFFLGLIELGNIPT